MPRRKSEPPDTERLVTLREAREAKQARKRLEGLAEERRATKGRGDMAAKAAAAQVIADTWNAAHEVGCDVEVTKDDGSKLTTITRATAGVVGCAAVIWVVGIVGCYALERVVAIDRDRLDWLTDETAPHDELAAEREHINAAAAGPAPDAVEVIGVVGVDTGLAQ